MRPPSNRAERSVVSFPDAVGEHAWPPPEVSVVMPAYNEGAGIGRALDALGSEMNSLGRHYEILLVDDGSIDETVAVASERLGSWPLRIVCLSRNFGKEQAISAGLERARGKAVIVIDADMQEPLSCLGTFLHHWDQGDEMVYTVRAHREDESLLKRLGSRAFYALLDRSTSVRIPSGARDFRLMDRKVVEALISLPERNRFMKGLYSWVGFRTREVAVVLNPRTSGSSKFNYRRLISHAVTGLTSFSDFPLRMWMGVGVMVSSFSMLYAAWIGIRTLVWGSDVPGWATLTVAIFFLGGVQILSIGVLGEYLGRIFSEVKARPGHIVARELDGSAEG